MNCLSKDRKSSVIAALVEGASINATCRMTGVAKHTVPKLLKDRCCAAASYHDTHVRNVRVRRLQCDEIWAFRWCETTDGLRVYADAVEDVFGARLTNSIGLLEDAN